jgi:hypothetical protein
MKIKNLYSTVSLISIFVLTISFPIFSQVGKEPPAIDSAQAATYYLEMNGTINRFVPQADKDAKLPPLGGASVHVFYGTKEYTTALTTDKGKCSFRLPLNRVFKIQVSKFGYVPKFFEVNTKVPTINLSTYSFKFDVDLFEEIKKLDVSVLKKPIAKVTFDVIYDRFQYDESYTGRINFDIKKMYKMYYELQKAQTDSIERFNRGEKEPAKEPIDPKKKAPPAKGTPPPKKK